MQTLARRGKGIDEVIKPLTPAPVDRIRKPVALSQNYAALFQKYEEMLQYDPQNIPLYFMNQQGKTVPQYMQEIAGTISEIIAPEEINALLQATIQYEEARYYPHATSTFITRLIQNSFDAGYNGFTLHLPVPTINSIAERLCGLPHRRLQLAVIGSAGSVGYKARYCDVKTSGNINMMYGAGALGCFFKHEGEVAAPGIDASESEYVLLGKVTFLESEVISFGRTQDCTFKTTDEESIQKLKVKLPENRGNKIYLIGTDGNEQLESDA